MKACDYFGLEARSYDSLYEYKRGIDSNTIMIIGSAPEYAYGTIDPIEEINQIALDKKVPLHIDACMGGFLLPFSDFYHYINFSLEGITSISMDSHKYGYAPKGSSIILYRHFKYKRYQHYVNKDY